MLNTTNVIVKKTESIQNTSITENNDSVNIQRQKEESKFVRFETGSDFEKTVFATECTPFIYRIKKEYNRESDSPRNWRDWEDIYRTPIKVIQITVFGKGVYLVEYVEFGSEIKSYYQKHDLLKLDWDKK